MKKKIMTMNRRRRGRRLINIVPGYISEKVSTKISAHPKITPHTLISANINGVMKINRIFLMREGVSSVSWQLASGEGEEK